ncbi:MAG: hypothetical protein KGK08_01090 [Acidobacteriota bacterium]|nr:hypothetical protein [Acidobacteriota bacterium]
MRLAGMFLLLGGWLILLGALVLFPGGAARSVFLLAGFGLQASGLTLALRTRDEERRA